MQNHGAAWSFADLMVGRRIVLQDAPSRTGTRPLIHAGCRAPQTSCQGQAAQ